MEAVRVLKALDVKPRRTIRIALWSGEEQGEFGSSGYVQQHLIKSSALADSSTASALAPMNAPNPLVTRKEWETLDAYQSIDEGGRVRGIYTQGNYAVAPIFTQWIAPLMDLGVTTITNRIDVAAIMRASTTQACRVLSSFRMNWTTRPARTTRMWTPIDNLHQADLEQAAIVEAVFLWNTSEREATMPRKPFPYPEDDTKKNAPIPGLFPSATVNQQ